MKFGKDNSLNVRITKSDYPIIDFSLRTSTFFCHTVFKRCGLISPIFRREYILKNGLVIKNNRRYITSKVNKDKVISYDSETFRGKCKLLCLSENNELKQQYILKEKFESDISFFDKCLDFLMYKSNDSSYYRFFYNIDFDFSSILKLWNNLEQIIYLTRGIEITYKEYKITWLKGRMIIIKKGKHTAYFTDLFNFFKIGLNKASGLYLDNLLKDKIDGNKLNTKKSYWIKHLKAIVKYCLKDCYITSLLGMELIKGINECKLELPKFLVSSASLSKRHFRFHCKIPKIEYIPENILQISYDCYFGGRFEMLKSGYFEKLWLYDINSQYPTFIQDLPNLKYGAWKRFENLNELPKLRTFGYFYAKLKIPETVQLSTIPLMYKGSIKFVCGYIERWFTWYDLDLMREYITEISDSYIWIPDMNSKKRHRQYKPFKKIVKKLFKLKAYYKGKNELLYNLVKLTLNALYGCFIEQHKNYDIEGNKTLTSGILFNSVYASQITAFGRWSVIREIPKSMYKNIITIHTDSVMTNISLPFLKCNKKLGNWNLEAKGKAIILNTGMYQIGNIVKTRGIPKKYIKNWLRFCLKNEYLSEVEFKVNRMRKISQALVQDKELTKVNTFVENPKTVRLNSDKKRTWFDSFYNFKDLLSRNIDSLPLMCVYYDLETLDVFPNHLAC